VAVAVEPSGVSESFTCRHLRRRTPTIFSKRFTTWDSLSAVVMSKPEASMWQESRQTPMRLWPPARSMHSRSSSNERTSVFPATAEFSRELADDVDAAFDLRDGI
jgi:hypothetical protein